jgi:phage tail-like protein
MSDNSEEVRLSCYLPYEFSKKNEDGTETDALRFLNAFEKILFGKTSGNSVNVPELDMIDGLEEIIAKQSKLFYPESNKDYRNDFLPWLSQWVALTLRSDFSEEKKKDFIAKIVPLYKRRGTRDNMKQLLEMFTGKEVGISDMEEEPYYFKVYLNLNSVKESDSAADFDRAIQQANSVIELAKPAHTRYQLIPQLDTFRIGPYNNCPKVKGKNDCKIILGKNTRLGAANWKN